jgi:hypothetical protein
MQPSRFFTLFVIAGGLLLAKCDCTHRCTNTIPELNFVNFDSSELHAVIVQEYEQNGRFDRMWTSHVYTNAVFPGPDTFQLADNKIVIGGNTDYVITVPATGKTWTITELNLHYDHLKENTQCTSGMSYRLNDSTYTTHMVPGATDVPTLINLNK